MAWTGRQLRSTIDKQGTLTLSLNPIEITEPGDDEVVVRIEATPVNPSDIGMLLGPADLATIDAIDAADGPRLTVSVPSARMAAVAGRIGQPLAVGNEGAGTVIAAGKNVSALQGKRVGMVGGAMYADYRKIAAKDVIPLPDGVSAAAGASMFINPLTALGFVETARREGHKAIIHTAAASNLGQMLQRICLADGIPLINIVRSEEQAALLRYIGASHVLNSKDEAFHEQLTEAIAETGATIAFDAIGGGTLGSDILNAMERAAARTSTTYNQYGSNVFKQVYVYGRLDLSPSVLDRSTLGFGWSVSGWLLFNKLATFEPEVVQGLRQRVVRELTTTFASHYTRTVGLAEILRPDVLRAIERKATGEKFLIDPSQG
ncbi:zinc-binding dehydrogenase [Bordetella sp. 02P26C-1]|uniref:zinc-binding dehydrogenase n=1 Tax=Bordetella sp. 02P26C-1 TaxID=2683195 RepID=UPI001353146B|nr:zinc-binding dehydrogenase [Bordetella sp. 02P26C-1]MVW79433.1 zinc-binding dehydrogenase [Bordetella sp. 02P26C-1]